ncbi:MAG: acyl carrier protein [Planctomycetaceae bacterium]|jgi:acyl carrier protein|nr:acyl carrier protein [Planctomycetaceae bacterium]
MSAVVDELVKIIANRFGVEESTIKPETDILNDLGADSLEIAELLIEIEDKLSVSIDESEVQSLTTVADVINYVEKVTATKENDGEECNCGECKQNE